jgi:GNAT superfamily N-acetyltransferase
MTYNNVRVEVCEQYTDEISAGIGALMPQLDESFPATPIPEDHLRYIIESPDYGQIVAVKNDIQVVGAATMSIVRGAGFGKRGQLEDFVVDNNERRSGVSGRMWGLMIDWCLSKGIPNGELYLQTETYRPEAMRFYEKNGSLMPETLTYKGNAQKD